MRSRNECEITEVPLIGQFCSQGTVDVATLAKLIHEFQGVCSEESGLPGSKVILVGDQSVGKTSIFLRATRNEYSELYKPTIGLDFSVKKFNIFGVPFQITIWDTAGQERFRALSKTYHRGANCCICIFDLHQEYGLRNVAKWIEEVRSFSEEPDLKVFMVGSKSDLYRAVETDQIEKLAKELHAEYFEVSAKYNKCLQQLFERGAFLTFEVRLKRWSKMQLTNHSAAIISDECIRMDTQTTCKELPVQKKSRSCCM